MWRIRSNLIVPVEQVLSDGSHRSTFYASVKDRRHQRNGLRVRVIEYRLEGHPDHETYRLMTTLLDPEQAPAEELAPLYPERWELEGAFDELKTHLRGGQVVLRRGQDPGTGQAGVLRTAARAPGGADAHAPGRRQGPTRPGSTFLYPHRSRPASQAGPTASFFPLSSCRPASGRSSTKSSRNAVSAAAAVASRAASNARCPAIRCAAPALPPSRRSSP